MNIAVKPNSNRYNKFRYIKHFLVRLRNRLISARFEPVLSNTGKSLKASYYSIVSTENKIKVIKLIPKTWC